MMGIVWPVLVFGILAGITWHLSRSTYNQLAHFLNSGADNSAVTHESELQRLIDTAERYYSERKWTSAEKAFLRVLKLDHKNLTAYRRLALVYSYLHNYADAQECLELVMRRETTAADLHNYSTILYHAKQSERAIQAMEQAIELEPSLVRYMSLSKMHALAHQPQKQLEALLAAHEFDRTNQPVVQSVIQWYRAHQDSERASQWQQLLIEKNS
ncbi:hypothetical protein IT415_03325 [bacterium]|nr:hypothetical protein [bacterium]